MIELQRVAREYPDGAGRFVALHDVDLVIKPGEFVAIRGPSGSGKSTLMNIIGCLDRPTAGYYRFAGVDTARLNSDEQAALRRESFGFIFQRYVLLPNLSARANVELPALYAGISRRARQQRATDLLCRLGLGDRLNTRAIQLSGGQQQRVGIARALMNGGRVVLADEPTGALDTCVTEEVLQILKELHAQGRTIILVTHDETVAARAERIITLTEGKIAGDVGSLSIGAAHRQSIVPQVDAPSGKSCRRKSVAFFVAVASGLSALRVHRLRTFLATLGIVIGVASVASVVALGNGGRETVLGEIRALGTNTIEIYPGHDFGDEKAGNIRTLIPSDATALAGQSYIEAASPWLQLATSLRTKNATVNGFVHGVANDYFRIYPFSVIEGNTFTSEDVQNQTQVVVIDDRVNERLFNGQDSIGRVILVGNTLARVVGVVRPGGATFAGSGNLNIWMPYSSLISRLTGHIPLRSITVRVRDEVPMDYAAAALMTLLRLRHSSQDFFLFDTDTIRKSVESAAATMRLLVSTIAGISLVVGGIGVMNIMLVSVADRTREIGIRMAVGARRGDILQQYLFESVFICLIGGILGVILALIIGVVYSYWSTSIPMSFSPLSIAMSVMVSTFIGVTFGILPARQAANSNLIDALAHE